VGGVLQNGVVHAFRTLGHSGESAILVEERKTAAAALRRLTGADPGDDPAAWRAWYRRERQRPAK
jgi:hypothetical protein